MSIALQGTPDTKVIEADLTGKLTKEDYERFGPEVEKLIRERGKLRILVKMHDFDGWTLGGFWQDLKFDMKHFRDIERIAFIGDEKWEKGMSSFCKPFTSAEIGFFTPARIEEARLWLNS